MSEQPVIETRENVFDTQSTWGVPLEDVRCPHCDWHYLIPKDDVPAQCPHCFQAELVPLGEAALHLPYQLPPERVLPFAVDAATVRQNVATFASGIPFAPRDLNVDALRARVRRFYFPMWLVDGDVNALWDAEVGFDYEVVSHRERYADGGGWATEEVRENRVRWEPRAGRLDRHYDNIAAPASEGHAAFERALGSYALADACPYDAAGMRDICVRLPDRAQSAAWPDAIPGFQQAAAADVRRASRADHIRRFRWSPEYTNLNWSLLLLPVYATYYLDDEQQPQPVFISGQSGRVSGARRASMQRAQRAALIIAVVALLLFLLGLILGVVGLMLPPLIVVGIVLAVLSFMGGVIGALIPIVRVSRFNRTKVRRE